MFPFSRHRNKTERDLAALKQQQVNALRQAVPVTRAVNSVSRWMDGWVGGWVGEGRESRRQLIGCVDG